MNYQGQRVDEAGASPVRLHELGELPAVESLTRRERRARGRVRAQGGAKTRQAILRLDPQSKRASHCSHQTREDAPPNQKPWEEELSGRTNWKN